MFGTVEDWYSIRSDVQPIGEMIIQPILWDGVGVASQEVSMHEFNFGLHLPRPETGWK